MDKYEELQCIGRGNYGTAHLAIEKATGHRYVIKKIPTDLLSDAEKQQSFREIDLLSTLQHPNVVEYKESFVARGIIHIVMAYCDGGDLAARIKARAKDGSSFSIRQILDWFVQMCMAIQYLHDNRVLHRDLKTSNIFLTTQNVIKLGDFGIARTLDSTLDQAKTVVGTPYYMSPEVCESRPYSYTSDVWALGCVLYELCTLQRAFDAPNFLMLILKIVQQDFPPLPPQFDRSLTEIITRLLDKRPEKRPTMEQLFQMPFIRTHMQGLMASGGSLKGTVGVRRLKNATPRKHARHRSRRSSGDNSRRRLAATSGNAASVHPRDLHDKGMEDDGEMEMPLSDDASLDLRLPERSSTPEPLLPGIPDLKLLQTKDASVTMPAALHPTAGFAWTENPEQTTEIEERIRTAAPNESQELMNPNFRDEYSEEFMDSKRVFYRGRLDKDDRRRGLQPTQSPKRRSGHLQRSGSKSAEPDALDDVVVEHLDDYVISPLDVNTDPGFRRRGGDDDGTLTIEEEPFNTLPDENRRLNHLSESVILRQLELDQESLSDDQDDAYTSRSEYGGEDNFYSDDEASYSADPDFEQDRETVYSDDFEDADAEVIEYADDAFIPEDDSTPTDHPYLIKSPSLRPSGANNRNEVAWVMQNVAQSLLESCDQLSLQAT